MTKLAKSNSTSGPPPTVGKRRPRFSFSRKDKEERDQHHVRTPSGRWVKDDGSNAHPKIAPDQEPAKEVDVADLTDDGKGEALAGEDNAFDSGPQIPPWHLNRPAVQWDLSPAGSSSQQVGNSSSGQSHAQGYSAQNGSSTTKLHHVHTPPAPVPFPVPHQYTKNHSHSHSRSKPPHSSSSSHKYPTMRHKPGSLYPMHNPIKPTMPYRNWHLRPPDLDLPPIFMSGHAGAGRMRTISNPTATGGIAGVGANVLGNPEVASPTTSHPPTTQPPSNLLRTQKNTNAVLGHSSSHQSLHPQSPSDPTNSTLTDVTTVVGPMTRSASEPAAYGTGHDPSLMQVVNNPDKTLDLADPWGRNWHHPSPYDLGGPTGGLRIPMPGAHSAPIVPLTSEAKERDKERGRQYETIATSKPRRKDPSPLAVLANTMGRSSHEHRRPSFDARPDDRPPSPRTRKKSAGNGYSSEKDRGYISDKGGYISASDNEGTGNVKRPAAGFRGFLTSASPSNTPTDEPAMIRHRSDSRIGMGAAGGSSFEVVGRVGAGSRQNHTQRDEAPPHDPSEDHSNDHKDGHPLISHPVTLQRTPSTASGAVQRSESSRLVGHQKSHSHLGHGDPGTVTDYTGARKLSKHKQSASHDVTEGSITHGLRRFYSRDGYGGYGASAEHGLRDGHFPGGSKRGGGGTVLGKLAKKLSFVGKSQKDRDRERDAMERDRLLRAVEVAERERERNRDQQRAKERERLEWERERERERQEEQADANRRLGIGNDQEIGDDTAERSTSIITGASNPEMDHSLLTVEKPVGTSMSSNSRPASHGQASSISHPSPQPPRHSRTPSFSNPPSSSPSKSEALLASTAAAAVDRGMLDPRSPAPKTRASLLRASKSNLEGPGSPMSFDQPLSPLGRLAASLIPPKGKEKERGFSVTKSGTLDSPSQLPSGSPSSDHRGQGGRESPPPERSESPQPLPRLTLMLTNPDVPSPPGSARALPPTDDDIVDKPSARPTRQKPTRAPPQIPVGPPDVPAAASTLLGTSTPMSPSASPGKTSINPTPSPHVSAAPITTPSPPAVSLPASPSHHVQKSPTLHGSQGTAIAYTDGVNTWLIPTQTIATSPLQAALSPIQYDATVSLPNTQPSDPRGQRNSQRPESSVEFPAAVPHHHQRTSSGSQANHYASAQHGSRSADSLLPQAGANGHIYMPMAYPAPFMLQHLPSIPTPSSSHTPLPPNLQHLPNIPTPSSSYHHLPMSPAIHSVLGGPGPGRSHLNNVTSGASSISSSSSTANSTPSIPPPPLPKSPPTQANHLRYSYRPAQRPPLQPQTASDPPPTAHDKHLNVHAPQPARRETVPVQTNKWELVPEQQQQQQHKEQAQRAAKRFDRQSDGHEPMTRGETAILALASPRERDRALRENQARERKREERRLMEQRAREEDMKQNRAREEEAMRERAREEAVRERAREEAIRERAREEEARRERAREEEARRERAREEEARRERAREEEAKRERAREEDVRREREAERERVKRREMEQNSWNGVSERQERHRTKHLMAHRLSTIPPTPPPKEGLRLSQLPEDMPSIRSSQVSSQRISRATSRPDSSATMTRNRQDAPATLTKPRPESTSTSTSTSASSSSGSRPSRLSKPPPTRPPPPSAQVNLAAHHVAPIRPTSEGVIGIDLSIRANEAMQRDRMMKGASLVLDRTSMVEHVLGRSIPPQPPEKDRSANPPRSQRMERPASQQQHIAPTPYGSTHTSYTLMGQQPKWGYTPAPPPNMLNPLPRPPRDIDLQAH